MTHSVVLAVDIGTSSVRAALYSPEGDVAAMRQTRYGVIRPAPFMEEQDPEEIRRHVWDTVAACLAGRGDADVRGVSFSSQMYSVFPVDAQDRPLHNSILWSDGRAESTADNLRAEKVTETLYRKTGCPVNSLYPLAKILWLVRHRADLTGKASRFVSIKDYIIHDLIGEWAADYSMASGSGMFDLVAERWSQTALTVLKMDCDRFPGLVPGDRAMPIRNTRLARRLGLSTDVPVFLGGGDGPLANIGSGACGVGSMNIDLGTSGAARVAVEKPMFDVSARLWCYAIIPGRYAYGGIVTNAGNAMQWLGTHLSPDSEIDPDLAAGRLGQCADGIELGADGVFVLPYFRRARSPYWDERLRGTVFGLTASHDIRHLARATLEAIAYDLAAIVDAAEEQVPVASPVILTGGLSKSPGMPALLANVLGKAVETPTHCEGSLAGAAVVGLRGAGLLKDYAFNRSERKAGKRYDPEPTLTARYRELRATYDRLVEVSRSLTVMEVETV
ncbi:MAG: gluconokinase [Planctomycetaceae bacterium]|nr:gluconokinase [Planctomycetaceae bacterium]